MGMESVKPEVFRAIGFKPPAIVLPAKAPETPSFRARYRAIRASLPRRVAKLPAAPIVARVLALADLTWPEAVARGRHRAAPRQAIAWVLYESAGWSSKFSGKFFGGFDHSTIIHSRQKIGREIVAGGTIFLRARDVARVAALKAAREAAAIERAAALQARIAEEKRARTEAAARCEAAAVDRWRESLGAFTETALLIANEGAARPISMTGRISKPRSLTALRDRILHTLRAQGCSTEAMSAAFGIRKAFVTIGANRHKQRIAQ